MVMPTIPATPRPSQVIAEALVERQDPRQIADRAADLGFPRALAETIVAACCPDVLSAPPAGAGRRFGTVRR